jgi:hypothetical protein
VFVLHNYLHILQESDTRIGDGAVCYLATIENKAVQRNRPDFDTIEVLDDEKDFEVSLNLTFPYAGFSFYPNFVNFLKLLLN